MASLKRPGSTIARCKAFVLHSGYDTSEEGQARKRARDEKLLKLDLEERPDHPFVLFNLGMTAHYTNDHIMAIDWLRKCIRNSDPAESHVRKAYAMLAVSHVKRGDLIEAGKTLRKGLKLLPDDPELHFHAAQLATTQERYDDAKKHYKKTLEADIDGHFSSVDRGILGFKTMHNLAQVDMLCNDYQSARDWWRKAADAAPEFLPSVFCLFDAAVELKDFRTAAEMHARVKAAEGYSSSWAKMAVKYGEAVGGQQMALDLLTQALQEKPNAHFVQLEIGRILLDRGDPRATAIFDALSTAGIAEGAYLRGIAAIRQGQFAVALAAMRRALELNPGHKETIKQIEGLVELLKEDRAS